MLSKSYSNLILECGTDEAGRGCLAGPVTAAAVLLPAAFENIILNDSKQLSEKSREKLKPVIEETAISFAVTHIFPNEIDEINILNATKKGLTQVVGGQKVKPDIIIVDALNNIDTLGIPYTPIIKGDALAYSISCASIIAKVTRDRIMRQMDEIYPEYGFAGHKGYGTAKHIAAIKEYGLCKIHRRSFTKNFVK